MSGLRWWAREAWTVAVETWRVLYARSGLAWAMGAALALGCGLLPLALGGGGAEKWELYLTYGTGGAGFALSVFALWTGCAAVSGEAEGGTLAVLLAKPEGRGAVWCGKWLAVTGASWLLSGVAAAAMAAAMAWGARGLAPEERAQSALLSGAYETRRAPLPDVSEAVERRLEAWVASGGAREGKAAEGAREALRRDELAKAYRLAEGHPLAWRFDLRGRTAGQARLSWLCHPSVPGTWRVRGTLQMDNGKLVALDDPAGARREVPVEMPSGKCESLGVEMRLEEGGEAAGVDFFFDPEDGMTLRVPRGGVRGNAAKAWAALAGRLALLSAVGVTLGTLFSMPVASFLAVALLVVLHFAPLLDEASRVDRATFTRSLLSAMAGGHGHGGEEEDPAPGGWRNAMANGAFWVYRGTAWALRPFLADKATEELCAAEWIDPGTVARQAAWRIVALPAALGVLGACVLRRREWGGVRR